MNFLSKFRTLISSENGQVVPRQYFWVQFSYIGIKSLIPIDDIGLYVRGFDLPNLSLDEDGAVVIKNPRGTYKVPGDSLIIPESNSFTIDFLETEYPIIEDLFVPWLEQVVNIRRSGQYPFPKAEVVVYILSANDPGNISEKNIIMEYTFSGTYPTLISLPTLTNDKNDSIARTITFAFNKTHIKYNTPLGKGKSKESDIPVPKDLQKEKLLKKVLDKSVDEKTKETVDQLKNEKKKILKKDKKSSEFDIFKEVDKAINTAKEIIKTKKQAEKTYNTIKKQATKAIKEPNFENFVKVASTVNKKMTHIEIIDKSLGRAKEINKIKKEL